LVWAALCGAQGQAQERRPVAAYEGANEVQLRVDELVRHQCGGGLAAFRWYEDIPQILHDGSLDILIAMARKADEDLQQEFGLPLGLIIIDTLAFGAGYEANGENDTAINQKLMNILRDLARTLNCFVLAVDHYGKNIEAGTRGNSAKESSADLVLACLGRKSLSGSVEDTRMAVRKNRGGRQGQQYSFGTTVV
jgi:hypothetical protein